MSKNNLFLLAVIVMTTFLHQSHASILNSAESFAVLANSTVTNTGITILNGNLGLTPGTSITGFPPGIVNGTIYTGTAPVGVQAMADANSAYTTLTHETVTSNLTGQDLGGLRLPSGVYFFDSSAGLTGALTLDGLGNTNSQFVFLIGSTFTSASFASIVLVNGASASNVFWQIGSSATFGTASSLEGNFLATNSITMNTGADLVGSAFALNGAVTLDSNIISTVPEPSAYALLGLGSLAVLVFFRRKAKIA